MILVIKNAALRRFLKIALPFVLMPAAIWLGNLAFGEKKYAWTILVLTVFSLLSLSTAAAEKRVADASVQAVCAYYEADLRAEEIYARLRSGESVAGVHIDGQFYRYSCPVTENQLLEVELKKEKENWVVCRWQVIARSEPVSDPLPVWNG